MRRAEITSPGRVCLFLLGADFRAGEVVAGSDEEDVPTLPVEGGYLPIGGGGAWVRKCVSKKSIGVLAWSHTTKIGLEGGQIGVVG